MASIKAPQLPEMAPLKESPFAIRTAELVEICIRARPKADAPRRPEGCRACGAHRQPGRDAEEAKKGRREMLKQREQRDDSLKREAGLGF